MATLTRDVQWLLRRPRIVGSAGLVTAATLLWHLQFAALAGVALAEIGYALWKARSVCGATTRGSTPCTNNGKGLLRGCHLQAHNEQRMTTYLWQRNWPDLLSHLRRNTLLSALLLCATVLLLLAGVGSVVRSLVTLVT